MNKHKHEIGAVNPLLVLSVILGFLMLGFSGAFFWAYANYLDQRDNTSAKIDSAVSTAKQQQSTLDEKKYVEEAKQPYEKLVGPSDLGSVSISYPKTWSVYVAKTNSQGYDAYLNPGAVPAVSAAQPFATRISISDQAYDTVVNSYQSLVKAGKLKATPITVNNLTGLRLDGSFSATRNGSVVIFKVRDKTLVVSTDMSEFQSDFDNVIVKSLDFNP